MPVSKKEKTDVSAKILEKKKGSSLVKTLTDGFSFSELQSILLDVYHRKLALLSPADVLRDYRLNRFVQVSSVGPEKFLRFDQTAFSLLPQDFETLELPPLGPLGMCSVLAPVHQNNVVSTLRHSEVLADATNYLALEAAVRRKNCLSSQTDAGSQIKLAASHRVVRAQRFEFKGYTAHFKIFSLCTAGRGEEDLAFETRNLREHVLYYFALIDRIVDLGRVEKTTLKVFDLDGKDNSIFHQMLDEIVRSRGNTSLNIERDSSFGQNYYIRLRFMINIVHRDGLSLDYIDGGFTDWTMKLLSDKKERLLTSGAGSELLIKMLGLKN